MRDAAEADLKFQIRSLTVTANEPAAPNGLSVFSWQYLSNDRAYGTIVVCFLSVRRLQQMYCD